MTELPAVLIRPAAGDEAETLALLGGATFLETFAGTLPGEDILAHCRSQHSAAIYQRWLDSPTASLWIAATQPAAGPIGYAVIDKSTLDVAHPRAGDYELKRIYVFHRFHGSQAGVLLMNSAVAAATEKGAERVLLGVYEGNHRALRFYAKSGFVQVGSRQFKVGQHHCSDLILAKPLARLGSHERGRASGREST